MGDYYYSAKNNGFYLLSMKENYENSANGWPEDAVLISDADYSQIFKGQAAGKIIAANSKGYPELIDPPAPGQDELIAMAESKRTILLTEAAEKIAPLQDAVDLDLATESEITLLRKWKKYRVDLSRLDISEPSEISWPEVPDNVA